MSEQVARASDRFILTFQTADLAADLRQVLWGLLIEFAIERGRADEFSIDEGLWDTDVPDLVIQAQQDLIRELPLEDTRALSRRRRRRHAERRWTLDERTGELLRVLGPYVVSVNLYRGDTWVAGVFDWGDAMALTASGEEWKALQGRITSELGVLPAHDAAALEID